MKQIVLVLFNGLTAPHWNGGSVYHAPEQPRALKHFMDERLADMRPDAWLFWDVGLGAPDFQTIHAMLDQPDDLWHAGLSLGTKGQPGLMDFVEPTWALNRDPERAASSWRISLRACLVRDDVLRQMEFIHAEFETLDAAVLEWGHRCIQRGVFCRYEPNLIPARAENDLPVELSPGDELRFVEYRFGRRWRIWAFARAVMSGYWKIDHARRAMLSLRNFPASSTPTAIYQHSKKAPMESLAVKVSVIIPTLDRYAYLKTILNQLRGQTIAPLEIIVIDQTSAVNRQTEFYEDFNDLPLMVIFQAEAGQCSSRNAGLQISRGDYILFIDDDDEIQNDLIKKHFRRVQETQAEASCGVADEVGAGELPHAFTFQRVSDVFSTNNSFLRRDALTRSGLFDLAYERGARADGDLGMRLYLSGARLILNPHISVLHHHAPRGGLRSHKARVITYASSRRNLLHRNLPGATEMYLVRRYFTPRQFREMLWISVFASFSLHHESYWMRSLKVIIGFLLLPDTLLRLLRNYRQARQLMARHPTIPSLTSQTRHAP